MERPDALLTSFGAFSGGALGYLFSGGEVYAAVITALLWGFLTIVITDLSRRPPEYGPHQ